MGEKFRPNPESPRTSLDTIAFIQQVDRLEEPKVRETIGYLEMIPEREEDEEKLLGLLRKRLELIEKEKEQG